MITAVPECYLTIVAPCYRSAKPKYKYLCSYSDMNFNIQEEHFAAFQIKFHDSDEFIAMSLNFKVVQQCIDSFGEYKHRFDIHHKTFHFVKLQLHIINCLTFSRQFFVDAFSVLESILPG